MPSVKRLHLDVTVLHPIPYRVYDRLVRSTGNSQLRMSYHDGTLEIVSPRLHRHEKSSRRLSIIVTTVANRLALPYEGTASYTFRKAGDGPYLGKGKEPDQSFYIANLDRLPLDRDPDLDAGDPPPDLWIEVDNRVSSAGRLPVHAALRVPEVWRHRPRRKLLQFLGLHGESYEPIDRSLALRALTPSLVLDALALGEGKRESEWLSLLIDWVDRTIPAPQAGP